MGSSSGARPPGAACTASTSCRIRAAAASSVRTARHAAASSVHQPRAARPGT